MRDFYTSTYEREFGSPIRYTVRALLQQAPNLGELHLCWSLGTWRPPSTSYLFFLLHGLRELAKALDPGLGVIGGELSLANDPSRVQAFPVALRIIVFCVAEMGNCPYCEGVAETGDCDSNITLKQEATMMRKVQENIDQHPGESYLRLYKPVFFGMRNLYYHFVFTASSVSRETVASTAYWSGPFSSLQNN